VRIACTFLGLAAATAVSLLGMLACSDAVLRAFPDEQCLPVLARHLTSALGAGASGAEAGLDGAGGCWASRAYRLPLAFADLTPNMGQWWYFFAQMFPAQRAFFCCVAHALPALFAGPAALRFPRAGPLLLALQVGASAMLRPYPAAGHLGLYLSLLPLLHEQARRVRTGLLLSNALLLLAVLGPAMWQQWIGAESANSNFFYSISLLLGVWHIVLLVQLLLVTVETERDGKALQARSTADSGHGCISS
jgi:hypothetical protein